MNKRYGHTWKRMYINPDVNGFEETDVVFDIWTQFRQCKVCKRLEEIDPDAIATDSKGKHYEFDGWFVIIPGDTEKCGNPCASEAWHVYYSRTKNSEYRRVKTMYGLKDTTSTSYTPEILEHLVNEKTYTKRYVGNMRKNAFRNNVKSIVRHIKQGRPIALYVDVLAIVGVWKRLPDSVMDTLLDKLEKEYDRKAMGQEN